MSCYAQRVNTSTQHEVAAEVRAQIARKRRSGRSVALQLGWTQAYMGRRLVGEVPFNVNDLAAIADVLEVPVTVFFSFPERTGVGVADGVNRGPRVRRT
jgi:hypothetical protein